MSIVFIFVSCEEMEGQRAYNWTREYRFCRMEIAVHHKRSKNGYGSNVKVRRLVADIEFQELTHEGGILGVFFCAMTVADL